MFDRLYVFLILLNIDSAERVCEVDGVSSDMVFGYYIKGSRVFIVAVKSAVKTEKEGRGSLYILFHIIAAPIPS